MGVLCNSTSRRDDSGMMEEQKNQQTTNIPSNGIGTIKVQNQWQCDVCKICSFPTFEEACSHEEECRQAQEQQKQQHQRQREEEVEQQQQKQQPREQQAQREEPPEKDMQTHPFFQKRTAATKPESKPTSKPKKTVAKKPANKSSSISKTEKKPSAKQPKIKLASITSSKPAEKEATRRSSRPKRTVVDLVEEEEDDDEDYDDEVVVLVTKKKAPPDNNNKKRRTMQTKPHQNNNADASLAPIFQGMGQAERKALVAEQKTAEFRAQRLKKQREQQEKKLRREQDKNNAAASASLSTSCTSSWTAAIAATKPKSQNRSSRPALTMAPRFPVPSHVRPKDTSTSMSEIRIPVVDQGAITNRLVVKPRSELAQESSDKQDTVEEQDCNNYLHLLSPTTSSDNKYAPDAEDGEAVNTHNIVKQLLSRILVVDPAQNRHSPLPDPYDDIMLEEIITTSLLDESSCAAQAVTAFCQKFMVEREQANVRMAERHRVRADAHSNRDSAKKRLQKHHQQERQRHTDDDLWVDTDDEDKKHNNFLPSLCLLTGPVGCGKSHLVHAVAQACGCAVLEINTSQKRSAAALKHAVEETTQSHSSLQMLTTTTSNIQKTIDSDSDECLLEDSDDERNDKQAAKGSSTASTAAVPVILIDEVDNIFEQDGDCGFWPALIDLTKRSKCPIILTANSVPPAIDVNRLTHIAVSRPTSTECVPILRNMIKAKGLTLVNDNSNDDDNAKMDFKLSTLAELCQCDLRRMSHEIQACSYYTAAAAAAVDSSPTSTTTTTTPPSLPSNQATSNQQDPVDPFPRLGDVTPRSVRFNEYVLLTITGTGFDKLVAGAASGLDGIEGCPVNVFVGDQVCPLARIMNNTTILAVKVPCPALPSSLFQGRSNSHRYQEQRSLTAEYKPISVFSSSKGGLLSTACSGNVKVHELQDGNKLLSLSSPVFVECHFSTVSVHATTTNDDDDDSDQEMEFQEETATAGQMSTALRIVPLPPCRVDSKVVEKILKEGIASWRGEQSSSSSSEPMTTTPILLEPEDVVGVEWTEASLAASDAAVLQDVGSTGVPFLAGTSRGFGFDFTEAFPSSTNEKNKPPKEDFLFSCGWKDNSCFYGDSNAYMREPPQIARERNLLKRHGTTMRGHSFRQEEAVVGEIGDGDNDNCFEPSELSEEECLLPSAVPPCLLSLPFLLRKAHGLDDDVLLETVIRDSLLDQQRRVRIDEQLDLLYESVIPYEYQHSRLFARGLGRTLDPLLLRTPEAADPNLFLDYLPILRAMSVHDRSARHVNDLEKKSNDNPGAKSNRSRVTRRSAKKGWEYYLETSSQVLKEWEEGIGGKSPREVCEQLAALCLLLKT